MNTLFERSVENYKDEWLTPPHLIKALGEFDLDPCSPVNRPWDTASNHFNINMGGLDLPWAGRVWCNPPYSEADQWLKKCAFHKNCIALVFARTETDTFFRYVWNRASGILFKKGRIQFYSVDGEKGGWAGAPSVFIAYDQQNARILHECSQTTIPGKFIPL